MKTFGDTLEMKACGMVFIGKSVLYRGHEVNRGDEYKSSKDCGTR